MLQEFPADRESEEIEQSIPERFEKIVGRYPDRLAAKTKDRSLSYRELNEASNRIAHTLLTQCGPGNDSVALLFEHGVDVIAGMLGALKGGKLFCVLDAHLPEERISYILDDIQARLILTNSRNFALAHRVANDARAVLNSDDVDKSSSVDNPELSISPDAAAYVVYTSGSTGSPRGVLREHQTTVITAIRGGSARGLRIHDRLSLVHSVSFGSGEADLYMCLLNGAAVCLFDIKSESIQGLAKWLKEEQITIFHLAPPIFRDFATLPVTADEISSLRLIRLSGAPITQVDFDLYKSKFPTETFLEFGMGSTEAGGICVAIVDRSFSFPREGSPVGRAHQGKEILILDDNGHPVDSGQIGEIAVKSRNLSPGYWKKPELTRSKFLGDPSKNTERVYLTGDMGRMLPDGMVVHLGRKDHMIKIRGYRVDISEVERALLEHPMIRDAGVAAWDREPGEKYLAGYVVPRQESALNVSELNEFLRNKLPDYMVPSAFVFLESLPLTNGKLDRKGLPKPDHKRPNLEQPYAPPQGEVETRLVQIWEEILNVRPIGINDNFLDLGGHSLAATRVVSRVIKQFQLDLPLQSLFQSPTVAEMAAIIVAELTSKQRVEFDLPLLQKSGVLINWAIPRREIFSPCPLSFGQERLWFLNQLEPENPVYNEPSAIRLSGLLDLEALEKTLNHVIARHEVLRTTIELVHGHPMQRIAKHRTVELPVIDLRTHIAQDRDAEAHRLIDEAIRRPFNLSTDLMLRVLLLQLGDHEHILVLVKHHVASDRWSSGVFWREVAALYTAFSSRQPANLPELPIQYADYAVWQREWLKGKELEEQLAYWKKQLEGAPAVLNLPSDCPRPAVQCHRGARQSITLSKDLSEKLRALSRKEGVTLYMTLLAAFQILLYRHTGQEDIVVGSPIANRNRCEIEGLIGFFINTLVLRSDLSGNPCFRELLGRVRKTALGAYEHQDLPFEKLVEELQPERSLSYSPLFQVLFNMADQWDSKLDLPGLTTARLSFSEAESKFDLTLYVKEQNDVISFNLVYRVDLFSGSWMTCFLRQYRYLIEQIVSAPEKLVRSYSLVTPESGVLLPDPSAVLAEPPQQLVTDTFLSWAKKTPAQTAVSQGEHAWTYEQLTERADTFERVLRARGLEPGDVVAVHGRRSFGLIAAMIGTLLSGGVLLLIDYNLPDQRKQLMLKEARARKILSIGDGGENAWVNGDRDLDILSVDPANGFALDLERNGHLKTTSLPEVSPNDPAYIFFTSGTTGIPKAVLGCHKGLSHFLKWQRETFAIEPNDRVAQLTSLSFDAVLRDIFLPLTSGATLCLPEQNDHPDSDGMIRWLEHERISVLHTVPSLAETWLAPVVQPLSLPDLRRVFFAGEPLTDALVRQWRSTFQSAAEIVNLYGPTETTLVKCFYRVPADMRTGVQPVGSPITETQALVLAHDNRLCGVNEPGEIVLRTPFRSLGYVNAPEESQKRFVKNPFREDPGDLIYFTGDAGRYRPDGSLEILGRLDDQVKIRGVRVEPAEVTAILSQHPLVASGIVVGKKNERGETCLVAYVVASEQRPTMTAQLRSYLLDRLPAAMVPSAFVFLDSLPLTPNGKLDRKALPEADHRRSEPERGFVAPRTELEKIVAGIWAEVLKLERIGVHDNFFDAGGHSLLATQTFSRIRVALQVDLSVRALFEKPTVASLCEYIEAIRWAGKTHQPNLTDNCDETEEMIL
jgi:amino acid adenylation domain-containing protein